MLHLLLLFLVRLVNDVVVPDDPARDLAALDDQLQDVIQYGFPPPGLAPVLTDELEIPL